MGFGTMAGKEVAGARKNVLRYSDAFIQGQACVGRERMTRQELWKAGNAVRPEPCAF
jgi:hypothetical protein